MKLSCLPVSLFQDIVAGRRSLASWFALAADLGLDGADISVALLSSRQAQYMASVRRQVEATGLRLVMMTTYPDLTDPDPSERARQIVDVRANIEALGQLGGLFLRVTAGQAHPGVGREEGIAWAVDGLTRCLPDAARAGVTLVYENHTKAGPWVYRDFSQPSDIFLEIVSRTEGSGLMVNYDTANTLVAEGDPVAVLRAVRHRVASIHAADLRRPGVQEPVVLGTGVAPVQALFAEMISVGFDGWVCIEESSRTGEVGFRQAVTNADRLWVQAGGVARH